MNIFKKEEDYKHFYKLLIKNLQLEKFKALKIVSYCLLPNHYHIVINVTDTGIKNPNFISKFF